MNAKKSMASPTPKRRGKSARSTRTMRLAPTITKMNGSTYAPIPSERCNALERALVRKPEGCNTTAKKSTTASTATITPAISRLVRSSKIRGSRSNSSKEASSSTARARALPRDGASLSATRSSASFFPFFLWAEAPLALFDCAVFFFEPRANGVLLQILRLRCI